MSTLQKWVQKSKLPPIAPVGQLSSRGARRGVSSRKRDYTPTPWNQYFKECRDISIDGDQFRVYQLGSSGPVLVLLHGGGFSSLTWALFSASVTSMVECQILAIDLRGHGDSIARDEDDLSAHTMARCQMWYGGTEDNYSGDLLFGRGVSFMGYLMDVPGSSISYNSVSNTPFSDVGNIVGALYGSDAPPIILIGHSMGGAIAVHTAAGNHIPSLIGLAVIDVVEGTALDALASMQSFLRGRPAHFRSLEHAIEWCVRSGQVRNVESAKVSMPGQIKNNETGKLATSEVDAYVPKSPLGDSHPQLPVDSIKEEDPDECNSNSDRTDTDEGFKPPLAPTDNDSEMRKYTWRIDLGRTEKYWSGWFKGLSSMFLSCPVPKMLLLAGIDRLDKDLTVGQMQGKFQMQVLPHCGHAVHEDVPDKVAEALATFMVRHKFAEPAANFERTFPAC